MELDRTEIAIRERSILELLDLSLIVLRTHCRPLMLASMLAGAPLMLVNVGVLWWMVNAESRLISLDNTSSETAVHWRHSWHLFVLWSMQFPIASLPVTVYLGNRIFFEDLNYRQLIRRIRPIAWRSLLVLGIVRLGLLGLLLEPFVNGRVTFEPMLEILLLGLVLFGGCLAIRTFYPFAPEILGLEVCRLRSTAGGDPTYWERSKWLHINMFSENIARFIVGATTGVFLGLSVLSVQVFVLGVTLGQWQWNAWFDHLLLPLTLWLVGVFLAVYRFLAYLDSRIRLEGWEIELQIRAEARRLEILFAPPMTTPVPGTSP